MPGMRKEIRESRAPRGISVKMHMGVGVRQGRERRLSAGW